MVDVQIRRLGRPNKSGKPYRPNQTEEQKRRARERNKEWRRKNRAKLADDMRAWRKKNRDHHRRYVRQRYREKPPTEDQRIRQRKTSSQWAKSHPERTRKHSEKWRESNPGKSAENTARWRAAHPEKATESSRANARNRRAAKRGGNGKHTAVDISRIMEKQRGRCAYCQKRIRRSYHVDHIVPLSKRGSNRPSNIQLTCETCNLKKGARNPIDFARSRGLLL